MNVENLTHNDIPAALAYILKEIAEIKELLLCRPAQPSPTDLLPEILDLEQAAKMLGRSKSTIYKLTAKLEIPHNKWAKKLSFNKTDLLAWVESSRRKTIKEMEAENENETFELERNRRQSKSK